MTAVVDATPLISLALVEQLDLLPRLFGRIVVPPAVYAEVTAQRPDLPGAAALARATWIQIQAPQTSPAFDALLLGLDPGELEALLLAREIHADWVLMDERLGRRVAQALQLPVKGTLGVLLAAVHAGLLSKTDAQNAVPQLVGHGIRISPRIIAWFLAEIDACA